MQISIGYYAKALSLACSQLYRELARLIKRAIGTLSDNVIACRL